MTEPSAADPIGDAEDIAWLRAFPRGLSDTLGIRIVEFSRERVVATMPVDARTHQPFGLLHGGASVALAETVASLGGALHVDRTRYAVVGIEINANHVRSVRSGVVTATATPIHVGRTSHVWAIEITDERGRRVCVSRCTLAVISQERPAERTP
jgi:1,4-dihydroxy-2-naphthoyl-CoA hydrolase